MPKSTKKLNIFFNIAENTGVGYYRQYLQAISLREAGLANVLINDFTWGESRMFCEKTYSDCKYVSFGSMPDLTVADYCKHLKEVHGKEATEEEKMAYTKSLIDMVEPTIETLNKIGHWADILVIGRRDTSEYLSQWKGISQFFNIPVVWDTDDNVYATRPFNPGYRGYYPGSEAHIWNRKTAQEVDAITVSTENLKNVHSKDNPNIYVIPNAVEYERWQKVERILHPNEVRLALLLSSSHHEDAKLLEKAIPVILKKYPQAHLYFTNIFGYIFKDVAKNNQKQLHPLNWVSLKTWPEQIAASNFDIGLAPLVDNMFNRAKSNLRYIEYSAAKIASIVSPIEPYKKTVTHGKTGLFANNPQEWINYISTLIEDAPYRKKLASNASQLVKRKFDCYANAKNYLKIYEKIVKDFRRDKGKRKFKFQNDVFSRPQQYQSTSALITNQAQSSI